METVIIWLLLWLVPASIAYFLGVRRGRRGWIYGLLLGWIGLAILWFLPDLTNKTPERRAQLKQAKKLGREHAHAMKELERARERRVLGQYRDVTLYEDGLVTASGSCPLSAEITASVQDAGSLQKYVTSRVTLTRALTIGVFAIGAKKKKTHTVDTRELYLLIEAPGFESLTTCDPSHGPRVRQLATVINNAGKQAADLVTERDRRIAAAEAVVRETEPQPKEALTA